MDEKNITPSIMPKRLPDGVVKLTEAQLKVAREAVDAIAVLERQEAKEERRIKLAKKLGRAHVKGSTKQAILVQAGREQHQKKKTKVIKDKREQRSLRSRRAK